APTHPSRRTFPARSATTITSIAAGSLWPGPVSAAAEPRKGGAVRIGMGDASTTDSLDPATMLADYIYTVSWAARNNLTEVAPTGDVVPELAESWEASADLTTWTFRLRRGIEFHSGKT